MLFCISLRLNVSMFHLHCQSTSFYRKRLWSFLFRYNWDIFFTTKVLYSCYYFTVNYNYNSMNMIMLMQLNNDFLIFTFSIYLIDDFIMTEIFIVFPILSNTNKTNRHISKPVTQRTEEVHALRLSLFSQFTYFYWILILHASHQQNGLNYDW